MVIGLVVVSTSSTASTASAASAAAVTIVAIIIQGLVRVVLLVDPVVDPWLKKHQCVNHPIPTMGVPVVAAAAGGGEAAKEMELSMRHQYRMILAVPPLSLSLHLSMNHH